MSTAIYDAKLCASFFLIYHLMKTFTAVKITQIGWLEDDAVAKAERFDTVGNKWEVIANMQQKRGFAFGVSSEGKFL